MYSDLEKNKKKFPFSISLFRHRTKRLLSDIESEYQKYLDVMTFYMIAFLVMGIVFALFQTFSIRTCSVILGLFAFAYGAIKGFFVTHRRRFTFYRFTIFPMIISFLFGGILLFFPNFVFPYYSLFLGFFILLVMLERFYNCFFFFRMRDNSRYVFLSSTILSVLLAIVVMINPFTQLLYGEIFGIFSIFFSILNLSMLSLLQRSIVDYVACFD